MIGLVWEAQDSWESGVCGTWHPFGPHPALSSLQPPPPRSAEFRDFLKTALDKNPETRPSAAQLLEVSGSPIPELPSPCPVPPLDEISCDLKADVLLAQPG